MSATCGSCDQEMLLGAGCTLTTYDDFEDRVKRERLPYKPDYDSNGCHDCNVKPGQLHHPGCDMERCPRCHGQAIACGCTDWKESGDE